MPIKKVALLTLLLFIAARCSASPTPSPVSLSPTTTIRMSQTPLLSPTATGKPAPTGTRTASLPTLIASPTAQLGVPLEYAGFLGNAVGGIKVGIVGHRRSVGRVEVAKFITALLK